jgi:hypothetical protein
MEQQVISFLKNNLLTLISVVVAFIGLYFAYKQINPDRPSLTIEIRSIVSPPSVNAIKDLEANFTFRGKPVTDLIAVTFALRNSNSVPLVGRGPKQNIVSDRILLSFKNGLRPINIEEVINQPNVVISLQEPNSIAMRFDQWRSEETLELTTYVEGKAGKELFDVPSLSRQIIDGVVTEIQSVGASDKRGLNTIFEVKTVFLIRKLGGFLSFLVGIVFLGFGLVAMRDALGSRKASAADKTYWLELLAQKAQITDEGEAVALAQDPRKLAGKLLGVKLNPPLRKLTTIDDYFGIAGLFIFGVCLLFFGGDTLWLQMPVK